MQKTIKTLHQNLTGWKKNNQIVEVVILLLKSGFAVVSIIIVLCVIGYFADRYWGFNVFFLAIGAFLGICLGWFAVSKIISKFLDNPPH